MNFQKFFFLSLLCHPFDTIFRITFVKTIFLGINFSILEFVFLYHSRVTTSIQSLRNFLVKTMFLETLFLSFMFCFSKSFLCYPIDKVLRINFRYNDFFFRKESFLIVMFYFFISFLCYPFDTISRTSFVENDFLWKIYLFGF